MNTKDWRESTLEEELLRINRCAAEDISMLDKYDDETAEGILAVLLEWACCSQNFSSIMSGRKKIAQIPGEWLVCHLPVVAEKCLEYTNDWNYRRLMELAAEYVPEAMAQLVGLNEGTEDTDLIEVMNDFRTV